jgi:hypothetical protein
MQGLKPQTFALNARLKPCSSTALQIVWTAYGLTMGRCTVGKVQRILASVHFSQHAKMNDGRVRTLFAVRVALGYGSTEMCKVFENQQIAIGN